MLKDDLQEVVSVPFEKVAATSLILKLLDLYSKLYLSGGPPNACNKCHRDYYNELKKTGMEKIERYQLIKNRQYIPAWNGLKYIPATARHWDSGQIIDSESIYLLEKGFLKESDFVSLPEKPEKPKVVRKKKNEATE